MPLVDMPLPLLGAAIFPVVTVTGLILFMRRRINGYTGDCCGATFLLAELVIFTSVRQYYTGYGNEVTIYTPHLGKRGKRYLLRTF